MKIKVHLDFIHFTYITRLINLSVISLINNPTSHSNCLLIFHIGNVTFASSRLRNGFMAIKKHQQDLRKKL